MVRPADVVFPDDRVDTLKYTTFDVPYRGMCIFFLGISPVFGGNTCMFEKTLVPVAFGEKPEELRKTGQFLKGMGARLVCLYHVDDAGSLFPGSDIPWLCLLQEALEEAGLATEVLRGSGPVAQSIAETALFQGCDAIYLKAKRRWHLSTTLLGSVAQDLLRISDVPVFVHKARPGLPDGGDGIHRDELVVLYATGLDVGTIRPLPFLREVGGARCHILHVRDRMADSSTDRRMRDVTGDKLRMVTDDLAAYYGQVSSEQRIGVPATQVLHVAERLEVDVIVLGRNTPAFLSAPMGETGEMVVNASKASVCLVP